MLHFDKVCETLKALPVAPIAEKVVQSVMAGKVTVLAAPTGSGKSMLVPAMLADATQEQVVVLVPRRFLATDAATNVAQMAGTELGADVGYAIGEMSGEKSKFSETTKLLFVTYGYAISSGLIKRAKHIVLDEVHEAAEDISLARAILHERKQQEPDLHLLEMSATINANRQADYWTSVAPTAVHTVEGQALACEERRQTPMRDGNTIAQTAVDLLTKENRNGIAIFRSGIKDVERTVEDIRELLKAKRIQNVEVVQIYGGTPADERAKARAAPKPGWKKIIVGTNVIESGVNLRWVDAGISDGMGKIPYDRPDTGAEALVQEHLPQWRVVQQRGRINRDPAATGFASGIFILHSNEEMHTRPHQASPELERCALTQFAFHAASLGYRPDRLQVDAAIQPDRWQEALKNLMRLGLVHEDWSLTKDGKYVARLPVSPETGAMLCEAQRMDIAAIRSDDMALKQRPKLLPEAIIMAALVEQGGIRKDYRRGHGLEGNSDIHGGSDVIDGLKAYLKLENTPMAAIVAHAVDTTPTTEKAIATLEQSRELLKQECAKLNVDYNGFCDAMLLVGEIRARHKDQKAIETDVHSFDPTRYNALKQVILNGNVNRVFQLGDDGITYRDLLRDYSRRRNDQGEPFSNYTINTFSALSDAQKTALTPLVVGKLREFPGKNGEEPEATLDQVTSIPSEVFIAWAAARDIPVLDKIENHEGKELSARYADCAHFTIPLSKLKPEMTAQIEQMKAGDNWGNQEHLDRSGYRR